MNIFVSHCNRNDVDRVIEVQRHREGKKEIKRERDREREERETERERVRERERMIDKITI